MYVVHSYTLQLTSPLSHTYTVYMYMYMYIHVFGCQLNGMYFIIKFNVSKYINVTIHTAVNIPTHTQLTYVLY